MIVEDERTPKTIEMRAGIRTKSTKKRESSRDFVNA